MLWDTFTDYYYNNNGSGTFVNMNVTGVAQTATASYTNSSRTCSGEPARLCLLRACWCSMLNAAGAMSHSC